MSTCKLSFLKYSNVELTCKLSFMTYSNCELTQAVYITCLQRYHCRNIVNERIRCEIETIV